MEASGIADSKKNPQHLWVHDDSGAPPVIHLLNYDGTVIKQVFLKGVSNRDWEELALFEGKLYIGELGDNLLAATTYAFYVVPEPLATEDTVYNIEKISFVYPDGPHDAEAFVVDPVSRDIYILTKRDNPSRIYKIKTTNSGPSVQTAVYTGQLDYSGITGASVSADGKTVIVKTYTSLFSYPRAHAESLEIVLKKKPGSLPYQLEPQGEAVCFRNDLSGYFTLSEKGFSTIQYLYFYKKK